MILYDFLLSAKEATKKEWLFSTVKQIIEENKDEFKNRLREQWERGEDESGKAAGYYKDVTEGFYSKINQPLTGMPKIAGDPYNFLWSGSLFDQISLVVSELILTVDSDSGTKDPLFAQINEEGLLSEPYNIFGLNETNFDTYINFLTYEIIIKVIEKLKI